MENFNTTFNCCLQWSKAEIRWSPFIEGLWIARIPVDHARRTITRMDKTKWMWALLILQPFRHFTYVTTHSPTLSSLFLRHSSFSNPSAASPTSQFILQPLFRLSYVTSSSLNSPGEVILQPFRHFTYVATHSPTLPSLHLRHSSFSNPSAASPTSQFTLQSFFRFSYVTNYLILQPFRRFTYVTDHSPTLPLLHLRHSSFSNTYFASPTSQALHLITWRAAHV